MSKRLKITIISLIFISCLISIYFFVYVPNKKTNDRVITIIQNKKSTIVAINYPHTPYQILNKDIKKYVNDIYDDFKEEYDSFISLKGKSELNIDYTYYVSEEGYISITLYTYIDSSLMNHPIKEIKTFVFDPQKKSYLTLQDLIKEKKKTTDEILEILRKKYGEGGYQNLLTSEYLKSLSYSIDHEKVCIFIPSYQNQENPYLIYLPLNHFHLNKKKEIKNIPVYSIKQNVIDPKKKVVALTFDDGPSKYTKKILKLLRKYHVTATFFVLGNKVTMYENTLKEMLQDGHEIGNHSYNHKLMSTLTEKEIMNQIQQTQSIIKEKLGYTPTSMRPTYGSVNQKIRNIVNMNIVLWNVDTLDWKLKDPKRIAQRGMKVKDGDIILMHDSKARTEKALSIMIPKLLKENYQFVTVGELEEVKMLREKFE